MELEGKALDAAVALALGWEHPGAVGKTEPTTDGTPWCRSGCNDWWRHPVGGWLCGGCYGFPYQYSSEWALGGPLIDEHRISLTERGGYWFADMRAAEGERGPNALTAAMRALVRSKTPNAELTGKAGTPDLSG